MVFTFEASIRYVSLRSRSFHFWQLKIQAHFLFLENFWFDFIFFHDELWHDRCGLYKHEWTPSNQFYPSNHWLNPKFTIFDFSWFLDWLCTSVEFQTLIPWDLDFKWCPKLYGLLIIDHGAQIPQEWPPSTALTDCWLSRFLVSHERIWSARYQKNLCIISLIIASN